ncbi:MAG: bifunctional UDP-N-acetylglucosamine pyrophosphorylase / Glucosamine-1-phosphate N-acetyltransferase [Parcubacteria group bacterium Gr01-1014_56]|nr:MAG: bifunctional UDP-N-acetylglucosamine pyrophosphorylase / Glucosamine-1-phosphate N-acetyltransferase [Parcubacteria group bacterium Gr01-1014_56]
MRPLTLTRPKPLVEVLGKPIIEHVVRALPDEIDEIIIVVKYLQEQIRAYCGETFCGKRVTYVEQGPQRGTAGALSYARPFINGRFLITFADDLLAKKDIEELLKYEYSTLVTRHDHPENFGVVSLNPDGTLYTIIEKPEHPKTNLISTGVSVLSPKIFDYQPEERKGEFFMTGMITGLAKDFPVVVVEASFWQPVGTPEDIPKAETALLERLSDDK